MRAVVRGAASWLIVVGAVLSGEIGSPALAQNATWRASPGSNNFNTGTNWTGNAVPTGTALFGQSDTTNVSISAPVTNLGALKFTASAPAYTFNVGGGNLLQLTGAGIVNNSANAPTFNVDGAGLVFRKDSSAANAIVNVDNGGLTAFIGTAGAGNARIVLNNTSVLDFSGRSNAENANIVVKNGSGVFFGGQARAGNATVTVRAGAGALFAGNSTAENATIRATAAGTVLFFERATGGTARFIVDAGGVVDFSNSIGQNGVVSAGSIEGAGQILIGNNFEVGGNNRSTEFSGRITGCACFNGELTKVGTGTLILSGANTYSGSTTVSGGTLQVDGSIARSSIVRVMDGGTLSGNGKVSEVVVKSGGTLAPGASVGTLTVKGDLTFRDGSTYAVDVRPNRADLTRVTGTARLNGTVLANVFGGQYVTRQFTILSAAGGRTGRFDDIDLMGFTGFNASLRYTSTDVILRLTAALAAEQDLTGNQSGVSNAINGFFNNGGALPQDFLGLFALNGPALGNALTQLSGEAVTGAPTAGFRAMNIFLNAMLNPFAGGASGGGVPRAFASAMSPQAAATSAYAMVPPAGGPAPANPWSLWAASYGGKSYLDGDPSGAGSHSVSAGAYGIVAGADYRVDATTWLGFAVSGGGNDWDLSNSLGGGDADSFQIGAYGVHSFGPAYVAAALGFGWHHVDTDRTVTIAGTDKLVATFDAKNLGGRIEGGYRFGIGAATATPYAAVQMQNYWLPSYGETASSGAATFALNYQSQSVQTLRTELGSWFESIHPIRAGVLALRGRLAWAHDALDDARLTATFQSLPGASFAVTGAEPPKDSALVTGAAELRLPNDLTLSLRLDGEFAGGGQTYAATASLRKAW